MNNYALLLEDGYDGGGDALTWFRRAAEAGETNAQLNLAARHAERAEHREAAKWNLQAAKQGVPKAMVLMGKALESGQGVRKDSVAAEKYYNRAADQGHGPAYRALGLLHAAAAQWAKSVQWHMKGAVAGDADCMAAIAEHYLEGRGVPASKEKALSWLRNALAVSSKSEVSIDAHLLSRLANLAGEMQEL